MFYFVLPFKKSCLVFMNMVHIHIHTLCCCPHGWAGPSTMATAAENSVVTDECLEELLDFFTGSAPYRAKNSTQKVSFECSLAGRLSAQYVTVWPRPFLAIRDHRKDVFTPVCQGLQSAGLCWRAYGADAPLDSSAVPYLSQTIDNKDGCLCAHYPASILVLQDHGKQGWESATACLAL